MENEPRWKDPRQVGWSRDAGIDEAGMIATQQRARVSRLGRFSWRSTLVVGAVLSLIAFRATHQSEPESSPPAGGVWNVELSSTGTEPVTALAFGRETGLHVVRVPGRNAPVEQRRSIPVRLAAGNVYLVSLGGAGLNLSSTSPAGAPHMAFTAQSRFVTLYQSPSETGVRTSWLWAP